jgi:hypothetical protein
VEVSPHHIEVTAGASCCATLLLLVLVLVLALLLLQLLQQSVQTWAESINH